MGGSSSNVFTRVKDSSGTGFVIGVRFVTRTLAMRVVHESHLYLHCHPSREIKLISHMSTRFAPFGFAHFVDNVRVIRNCIPRPIALGIGKRMSKDR